MHFILRTSILQLCHKKVKGFELKSHSRSDRIETIPDECAYMHSDIFHLWLVYITRQLLALSVRSDLKVTKSMNMIRCVCVCVCVYVCVCVCAIDIGFIKSQFGTEIHQWAINSVHIILIRCQVCH